MAKKKITDQPAPQAEEGNIPEVVQLPDSQVEAETTEQVVPAPQAEEGTRKRTPKRFIVVESFRDINKFSKAYHAGDDVTHFDAVRLEGLLKRGLVERK